MFSRRHGPGEAHPDVEVTAEDPRVVLGRLRQEAGTGIWLCGGATLAGQLAGEIDRLVIKTNPVLLGDGIPLLAATVAPRRFAHERSTAYESGVVVSEYRRDRLAA